MTPPEKPDTTAAESERTSVITDAAAATDKPAAGATPPAASAPLFTPGEAAGDSTVETAKPGHQAPQAQPGDPDSGNHTPPPWARVSADARPGPPGDATQALPSVSNGYSANPAYSPDSEPTVNVKRPVVTGTAAGRLFGTAAEDERPATPAGGTPLSSTAGTAAPSALRRPGRGPRRANLQVKRFDPWSVLKLSLVLGVALFFVWLVAVGALYAVLDGMGVWDKVNGISSELLNAADGGSGEPLISAGRVFGIAAIIGAINIVLFSALATVAAFVYNVSADLAGGLEVTLAERE